MTMKYHRYNMKKQILSSLRGGTTKQSMFFIWLLFLLSISACTDKFGDIEYVQLSLEVDTSKLDLPSGVAVRFTDAQLTMSDYNRWDQQLTLPVDDVNQSITIKRGYYTGMQFTAILHYPYEGEDNAVSVQCYLNGNSNPQNVIRPQVKATLPLERSSR